MTADKIRATREQRRVLLVEDNPDLALMLQELLRMLGHVTEVAADGASGIEKARCNPPDLALVDIGLPGIDGYAVACELRALPSLARTRLVAMTGYSQPDDEERAYAAGFDDHLVKPVDAQALEQLLNRPAVSSYR
jgi:CheY-like chemotaxis protein